MQWRACLPLGEMLAGFRVHQVKNVFLLILLLLHGSYPFIPSSISQLSPSLRFRNRYIVVREVESSDKNGGKNSNSKEEKEEEEEEEAASVEDNVFSLKGALERAVRQVTGENDYEFGLLGDALPEGGEDNEAYRYRFGDVTKSILAEFSGNETEKKVQRAAQQWRNSLVDKDKDAPIDIVEQTFYRLDQKQRINLILAGCQLGAEGIVLWGLITNACTLFIAALAWVASLVSSVGSTPFTDAPLLPIYIPKELWRTFTSKFLAYQLLLNPLVLIVQAVGTLIGFRKWHSMVNYLSTTPWIAKQRQWKRYNSHVLNKCIAVITTFFLTNVVLSAIVAGITFSMIGLFFRKIAFIGGFLFRTTTTT